MTLNRLRALHTHILVGIGTLLNDDPQLNCMYSYSRWIARTDGSSRSHACTPSSGNAASSMCNGRAASDPTIVQNFAQCSRPSRSFPNHLDFERLTGRCKLSAKA